MQQFQPHNQHHQQGKPDSVDKPGGSIAGKKSFVRRRRTLATLPIRGLPFPDPVTVPPTAPVSIASSKTSAGGATPKCTVPQRKFGSLTSGHPATVIDWLSTTSGVCAEDVINKSPGEARDERKVSITKQSQQQQQHQQRGSRFTAPENPDSVEDGSCRRQQSSRGTSEDRQFVAHGNVAATRGSFTSPPVVSNNGQPRWLGRTPSWPSALIRVKDRILEKVYITSSEWPHAAAIERERRQRAANAFHVSLYGSIGSGSSAVGGSVRSTSLTSSLPVGFSTAGATATVFRSATTASRTSSTTSLLPPSPVTAAQQQQPPLTADRRRARVQSDPPVAPSASFVHLLGTDHYSGLGGDRREKSKMAFRRRSISEDTCDRPSPASSYRVGQAAVVTASDRALPYRTGSHDPTEPDRRRRSGTGIVCSNDDLRAIVNEHRLRQSSASTAAMVTCTARSPSNVPLTVAETDLTGDGEYGVDGVSEVAVKFNIGSPAADNDDADDLNESEDICSPLLASPIGIRNVTGPVSNSGYVTAVRNSDATESQMTLTTGNQRRFVAAQLTGISLPSRRFSDVSASSGGTTSPRVTPLNPVEEIEMTDRSIVVPPDVVYDEHGQTWDVYGAEFDPEILGRAIQCHLERLMETAPSKYNQQRQRLSVPNEKRPPRIHSARRSCGSSAAASASAATSPISGCHVMLSDGSDERYGGSRVVGFIARHLCSVLRKADAAAEASVMATNV